MRITSTVLTAVIIAAFVAGVVACESDPTGPDERFVANMSASPGIQTTATGTTTFVRDGGVVSFAIDVTGMTGVTAAHIHGPAAPGANAGVIVGLFSGPQGGTGLVNGRLVAGAFAAADIAAAGVSMDSLLTLMRTGQSYVNVHTVTNPAGEIRGHIQVQ
jgi:hypothetical protein